MSFEHDTARRDFLKSLGSAGIASVAQAEVSSSDLKAAFNGNPPEHDTRARPEIHYPRTFKGPNLKMISFPLGGIGAGSIGLGGRGQFRDWEIFNKPQKGNSPEYAFASLWVQQKGGKPHGPYSGIAN